MLVLRIIIGILMIFSAGTVLSVPALGTIALSWFISAFMLVSGIFSVIFYIEEKNAEKIAERNGVSHIKTGVGSLVFGIVSMAISILARSSVIGEVLFIQLITVIFGLWIILNGISMIVCGNGFKKLAQPGWVAMIILGVLLILAGILCIVDCFAGLTAIGVMFGISMMMTGFTYIFG